MDKFFLGLGVGVIIGALMVAFSERPPQERTVRFYPGVSEDKYDDLYPTYKKWTNRL